MPIEFALGQDLMSSLDDNLQALGAQTSSLSTKYEVMLTRNGSIVKDTLSKLWKLTQILRDRSVS